jgi:uncharacterized membrane protein
MEFSGPIPPPSLLRAYEDATPGLADRIVKMAETQEAHRHSLEKLVIQSDIVQARLGLVAGFIVSMTAVIGGIVLILAGKDAAGLVAIIGALGSLAGAFIAARRRQQQELDERRKQVKGNR